MTTTIKRGGVTVTFDDDEPIADKVDAAEPVGAITAAGGRHRALTLTERDRLVAAVEEATAQAIHELIHTVTTRLDHAIIAAGPDDLYLISMLWPELMDRLILPVIGDSWDLAARHAANLMRVRMNRAIARYGERAVFDVVENARSAFMATARLNVGRLGDAIERLARLSLSEGFNLGESIPKLSARLRDVIPGLSLPEANVIARTQTIAASNGGALAQARAMGAEAVHLKAWENTNDARCRESHVQAGEDYADGIPLNEPFIVDGEAVDFPGDGSPAVANSCRCTILWVGIDEAADAAQTAPAEVVSEEPIAAAGNEVQTGAMIALVPSVADCERMAIDGYESPDQIHTTLLFLGDAVDWSVDAQTMVHAMAAELAASQPPFEAQLMATSTFGPADAPPLERPAVYLISSGSDGSDDLARLHDAIATPLLLGMCPDNFSPWVPHVSCGYGLDPAALTLTGETITVDRVRVAFAGVVTDHPFTGARLEPQGVSNA